MAANRLKRRRLNAEDLETSAATPKIFGDSPLAPATREHQKAWKGFCEIESEPAFFNVMLRDLGVEGIKVSEVYGLEAELLDMLPKPVYGLIFLFRWYEDDGNKQESHCPDEVWFANQTTPNACASVALLNIINNIPDARLGEHLSRFKDFTRDFPPALRGDQIANFDFLKEVHNSFARKMDMLNGDLALKNAVEAPKRKSRSMVTDGDEEAAFHFIAFVPIGDQVWMLDGLERQPHRLGAIDGSDWLAMATPTIGEKMLQYTEDQIQFGLYAVVLDPMVHLRERLVSTIKLGRSAQVRLDEAMPEWRTAAAARADASPGRFDVEPCAGYGIGDEEIDRAKVEESMMDRVHKGTADTLASLYCELVAQLESIGPQYMDELASHRADQDKADARRHDYAPMIRTWLTMLADKEALRPLLETHQRDR